MILTFRCPICETVGIRRRICPRCLGGGIFALLAPSTRLLGAARPPTAQISPLRLSEIEATSPLERTGLKLFDDALGGIGPGRTVLLSGSPGSGKTSLGLLLAGAMSSALFVSGEEHGDLVRAAADKLHVDTQRIYFLEASDLDLILDSAARLRPALLVLNSINTAEITSYRARPGTGFQIATVSRRIAEWTETRAATMTLLISQLTWENRSSGPRVLEHTTDAVLYLSVTKEGRRLLEVRKYRPPFRSAALVQEVPNWDAAR